MFVTNQQKERIRMNEPGDHHDQDRSNTNRNDVDSGPWFDPDELTPRSLWEKIGDGSFGKVYRAHLLGIPVAVKVIQNLKPDRVAGLKRDIFYLSRMTHPNVVPIYGAFIEEGMLHMVMEFVPNSLRNKRVVNQVNVVRVLQDVARALVRMHAQGHIHRDVKARNVLISAVRLSLFSKAAAFSFSAAVKASSSSSLSPQLLFLSFGCSEQLPKEREKRPKNFTSRRCLFCVLTSFVIVLILTTFHYPKHIMTKPKTGL